MPVISWSAQGCLAQSLQGKDGVGCTPVHLLPVRQSKAPQIWRADGIPSLRYRVSQSIKYTKRRLTHQMCRESRGARYSASSSRDFSVVSRERACDGSGRNVSRKRVTRSPNECLPLSSGQHESNTLLQCVASTIRASKKKQ